MRTNCLPQKIEEKFWILYNFPFVKYNRQLFEYYFQFPPALTRS